MYKKLFIITLILAFVPLTFGASAITSIDTNNFDDITPEVNLPESEFDVGETIEYDIEISEDISYNLVDIEIKSNIIDEDSGNIETTETIEITESKISQEYTLNNAGNYYIELESIKVDAGLSNYEYDLENVQSNTFSVIEDIPEDDIEIIDFENIAYNITTKEEYNSTEEINYSIDFSEEIPYKGYLDVSIIDTEEDAEKSNVDISFDEVSEISSNFNINESGEYIIQINKINVENVGDININISSQEFIIHNKVNLSGGSHLIYQLEETEIDEYIDAIENKSPIQVPDEAFRFISDEGEEYIVITNEKPRVSEANIKGYKIPSTIDGKNVIISENVNYTDNIQSITYDELKNNVEEYESQHVEIDGFINEKNIRVEPHSQSPISNPISVGILTHNELKIDDYIQIDKLSDKIMNSSMEENKTVFEFERNNNDYITTIGMQPRFWSDTYTSVSGIVENPDLFDDDLLESYGYENSNENQLIIHTSNISYNSENLNNLNNIENKTNESISVELNAVGTKISTKHVVDDVTPDCGTGETILTPKGVCVPLLTDVIIHAGVAWDENENIIPILGLSNYGTDVMVEDMNGKYNITGEVMSPAKFGIESDTNNWLIVHDMEKTQDINEIVIDEEIFNDIDEYIISYIDTNKSNKNISLMESIEDTEVDEEIEDLEDTEVDEEIEDLEDTEVDEEQDKIPEDTIEETEQNETNINEEHVDNTDEESKSTMNNIFESIRSFFNSLF